MSAPTTACRAPSTLTGAAACATFGRVHGRRALRALKGAIEELHLEAERYVRILDRAASVEDYRRYLRVMYGVHAPLERALPALLAPAGFEPAARCVKADWIRQDLRALGGDAEPPPWCPDLPQPAGLPSALGAAYVLEGSTLGGRYVLAKLAPALAPLRGRATRFLEGYGADTGARWRAFGAIVEREVRCDADEAAVIASARETFEALIAWLARHEHRAEPPPRRRRPSSPHGPAGARAAATRGEPHGRR